MSERLYGVVACITLIVIVLAIATLRINDGKVEQVLRSYPTGNAAADQQLSDSITPLMVTSANLSKSKTALVKKTDANGLTPLHWAVARNHANMVKLLLAQKADVNAQDKNGSTPLHWAAAGGLPDMAELLFTYNADVNIQDTKGRTALKIAEESGQREMALFISQHGGLD